MFYQPQAFNLLFLNLPLLSILCVALACPRFGSGRAGRSFSSARVTRAVWWECREGEVRAGASLGFMDRMCTMCSKQAKKMSANEE